MSFSEEEIKNKIGEVRCPKDECVRVAKETAIKLLGEECCFIKESKCFSHEEALKKIGDFLTDNSLVIIWVDTGPKERDNMSYRAIHFYIVYSVEPLGSFSIWENSGPDFYDKEKTEYEIDNTIKIFKRINIQQYGKRFGIPC